MLALAVESRSRNAVIAMLAPHCFGWSSDRRWVGGILVWSIRVTGELCFGRLRCRNLFDGPGPLCAVGVVAIGVAVLGSFRRWSSGIQHGSSDADV